MGSFRIGVSQTLVVRAIAEVTGKEPAYIFHRMMGHWDSFTISYDELIHAENAGEELSKPYPFYLAYAIEGELENLGTPEEWQVDGNGTASARRLFYAMENCLSGRAEKSW